MKELIISSFYFILPAYVANMAPVIAGKLNLRLGTPINIDLFGSHKTWRGVIAAYLGALIAIVFQWFLQKNDIFMFYNMLDYEKINLFLYAFLFGIGAITGDLIKSYFKRKLGRRPGSSWIPFDQLDFIAGALIFLLPFFVLPWSNILTLIIITPALHFLANVVAYFFGFKKVWW